MIPTINRLISNPLEPIIASNLLSGTCNEVISARNTIKREHLLSKERTSRAKRVLNSNYIFKAAKCADPAGTRLRKSFNPFGKFRTEFSC